MARALRARAREETCGPEPAGLALPAALSGRKVEFQDARGTMSCTFLGARSIGNTVSCVVTQVAPHTPFHCKKSAADVGTLKRTHVGNGTKAGTAQAPAIAGPVHGSLHEHWSGFKHLWRHQGCQDDSLVYKASPAMTLGK